MKKCLIIGGGLAGLSAAAHLVKNSYAVTLIEASPKCGGRTYSFYDDNHSQYIDNGQHLMMGCYNNTLELLDIAGGKDEIITEKKLRISFVRKGGELFALDAGCGFYPLNLLTAILNYKAISISRRFSALKFFVNNIFYGAGLACETVVEKWLENGGQDKESISALWGILSVSALNCGCDKASAQLFRDILKQIFLTGGKSAGLVFARNSLSETFAHKLTGYIKSSGGDIRLSERVIMIESSGNLITGVKTSRGFYDDFDAVISAVPAHAFDAIEFLPSKPEFHLPGMEYSPIVSAHFWLKDNPFRERMYGLIDSGIDWLFNNGAHITLVKSAADKIVNMGNNEIAALFLSEIKNYFPSFDESRVTGTKIIRERKATFIPSPAAEFLREKISSPFTNLVLAGDWTCTNLPATIEGAVKSGKTAAGIIIKG